MGRYAEKTSVPVSKSRMEIEETVTRYGARGFISGFDASRAFVAFEIAERRVKFVLALPDKFDRKFRTTPGGRRELDADGQQRAWEQACRSSWRALYLVIKAKLEAVASGITCFEDEFMAHILMPDGRTVGEHVRPGIIQAYESGTVPALLPDMTR